MSKLPLEIFETPSGNEFQVQKHEDGRFHRAYVVDGNGKRTPVDADTAIAFENFQLALEIAARANSDARDRQTELSKYGELSVLEKNAGFKPLVDEFHQANNFAKLAEDFATNYLREALRDADHTVRHGEKRAREWLADVSQINWLEGFTQSKDAQAEQGATGGNSHLPNHKNSGPQIA